MSTLVAQTISNGIISTSSANVINGAKAWVNFNGANGAIRASYNVSSVTRNSTGNYTITFTTAMPDAFFSAQTTASNLSDINDGLTTTTVSMRVFNDAGVVQDPANACVAVFR
jgi:hypothetical protein